MKVSDVNIKDEFITVKMDETIKQVSKEIAKAGIPDSVVIDGEGKVLGALDVYDIVSKCLAEEKDPNKVKAEEIMFAPPPVKLETDLNDVHEMMQKLEVTMLPVVDTDKKLLGVITIMDVLEGLGKDQRPSNILGRLFSR